MFSRDDFILEFFEIAVVHIEKELKSRFFHKMPEYKFMRDFKIDHDGRFGQALLMRLLNKETDEYFDGIIEADSLQKIPFFSQRLSYLPHRQCDDIFEIFYEEIKKLMNKAQASWETLYALDQCYVDRQNSVEILVERKNYIMSCGYSPIGSIRETETGSSTDGNSTNHTETEVSEVGWFHDSYETVITGSSFSSKTKNHYKYWQEYILEGKQ